jgi:uncharacterized damage-inducible protein DinB
MANEDRLAPAMLEQAHRMFVDNVQGLTLEEMLDAAGGYRSILGIAKHVAAWAAIYHSYAFEPEPRHWDRTDWPRELRDRVEPSEDYVAEVLAWFEQSYERWLESLRDVDDLDTPRPLHWGDTASLATIVALVAAHWSYHAGEINEILALRRGEAWEWGEEVEENHISTAGHGVRPPWMTDGEAAVFEHESDGR